MTLYSMVSLEESGLSVERPDGSPISPVAPPIWQRVGAYAFVLYEWCTHQGNDTMASKLEVEQTEKGYEMTDV